MKKKYTEKEIEKIVDLFENGKGVIVLPNGTNKEKLIAIWEAYIHQKRILEEENKDSK